MAEQTKLNLPLDLLAMDMVGAVLIGVGLSDGLGRTTLVPESLQFTHYCRSHDRYRHCSGVTPCHMDDSQDSQTSELTSKLGREWAS